MNDVMKKRNKIKKVIKKYNIVRVAKETKHYFRYSIVLFLFQIVSTVFMYIFPILEATMIDKGLAEKNLMVILECTAAYMVVLLLQYLFGIVEAKISIQVSSFIEMDLKKRVVNYFMSLKTNQFSKYDRGRIDTIVKKDLIEFQSVISDSCQSILLNIIQIITVSFAMLKINLILGIIIVIYQIFDMLVFFEMNKKIEKMSVQLRENYITQNRVINDIINHIRALRLVGAKDFMYKKLTQAMEKKVKQNEVMQVVNVKNNGIGAILNGIMSCGIYIIGGYQVIKGNLTVGMLIAFINYASKFSSPVSSLCSDIMTYSENIAQIREISYLLDEVDKEEKRRKKSCINNIDKIVIRNLNFQYTKEQEMVFEHAQAQFEKGNIYFIIGKSGSGKTTLTKILTGQYDLHPGMIQFDSEDIKNVENIEDCINWFPQEPIIFQDTIYNNIVLGKEVSQEQLKQVCEQCQIYDEIMNMDNNFNTVLEEDGHNISGGQKQRIALARLLLHNKDIILLDEATSALDKQTENMLKAVIKEIAKDKIAIIITHSQEFLMENAIIYEVKEKKLVKKQFIV